MPAAQRSFVPRISGALALANMLLMTGERAYLAKSAISA
jgi:hypothetical protein